MRLEENSKHKQKKSENLMVEGYQEGLFIEHISVCHHRAQSTTFALKHTLNFGLEA